LRRDLAVSLDRVGNTYADTNNKVSARRHYRESLSIRQQLATANPQSALLQRDLIVSFINLQELTGNPAYAQRALNVALSLQAHGQLPPTDAWMLADLRQRAHPQAAPPPAAGTPP
jgi:hypothetical protein